MPMSPFETPNPFAALSDDGAYGEYDSGDESGCSYDLGGENCFGDNGRAPW